MRTIYVDLMSLKLHLNMKSYLGRKLRPRKNYSKCRKRNLSKLTDALEHEFGNSNNAEPRQALSLVNRVPCSKPRPELMSLASLLSGYPEQEENRIEYKSFWKGCHSATLIKLIYGNIPQEHAPEVENVTSAPLHLACIISNPLPLVERLLDQGASVNSTNHQGQTPLHTLVLGDIGYETFSEVVHCLLRSGASLFSEDMWGNTPLLCTNNLLKNESYEKASHVARILLQAGSNPHHQNLQDHTLLVYSIQSLDNAYEVTRLLINNGASVWGVDSFGYTSAFLWLIKTIMDKRKFGNCQNTLHLICQLMHTQPTKMKHHVIQSVNRLSKCYEVYGELLLKVRTQMNPYWENPPSLSGICRHVIRKSLPPCHIERSINQMNIPESIKSFLLYDIKSL